MSGGKQRDMARSPFTPMLETLANACPDFLVAVFFDSEGETIDYHSVLDPFDTRLVAAHLGVVISLAIRTMKRVGLGQVRDMELYGGKRDSLTVAMGDDLFVAVMTGSGALSPLVHRQVRTVIEQIRCEVG